MQSKGIDMAMLNRRDFMKHAAGAAAVALAAPGLAAEETPKLAATTLRTLGGTGIRPTLLGVGMGVKAWGGHSELTRKGHDTFMAVLRHGYEKGIRYFDMADMYGAHPYVREALDTFMDRDKVVLLTKSDAREPEALRAAVEQFRKELGTDRLDVVLLHCLQKGDWPETLKPCMDVLSEFKAKNVIRAHGVSCHHLDAAERAAESPWVDVLLERINPYGLKMDGPPEKVVPVLRKAHENGKGVVGMKIAGEGQCADRLVESMRFVLGLGCIDAMPIGFLDPSEIDSAFAHIESLQIA